VCWYNQRCGVVSLVPGGVYAGSSNGVMRFTGAVQLQITLHKLVLYVPTTMVWAAQATDIGASRLAIQASNALFSTIYSMPRRSQGEVCMVQFKISNSE
jgi:hypothetical protein